MESITLLRTDIDALFERVEAIGRDREEIRRLYEAIETRFVSKELFDRELGKRDAEIEALKGDVNTLKDSLKRSTLPGSIPFTPPGGRALGLALPPPGVLPPRGGLPPPGLPFPPTGR
jgi:hypothetical protein